MALITTEQRNSVFKLGNSYLSVSIKGNGEIRVAFDAPRELFILHGKAFRAKLKVFGWDLEHRSFFANHAIHGRLHVRDVERLIDGGDSLHSRDMRGNDKMQCDSDCHSREHDATGGNS